MTATSTVFSSEKVSNERKVERVQGRILFLIRFPTIRELLYLRMTNAVDSDLPLSRIKRKCARARERE